MRLRMFAVALLCVLVVSSAPQAAPTDPQGVAVLAQSLNASGVTNPIDPVQDFVATGSITYFWAGEEVSGSATVRGRGSDQFRLDANLAEGTRSLVVNRGIGKLTESSGAVTQLPLHNTINLGVLTFPYLNLQAALADPATAVTYVGAVNVKGRTAHQVRVRRNYTPEQDPEGHASKLSTTDYFVDAASGLILKTLDMTHPPETFTIEFTHEIEFENYTVADRVQVPTLIREKIDGQTIWELRLSSYVFNTGVTDLDFPVQ